MLDIPLPIIFDFFTYNLFTLMFFITVTAILRKKIDTLELQLNIQLTILISGNYGWEICNYWQDQG